MNAVNKPLFADVSVNGHSISQADIAAEAQNHSVPAGKPGLAWRAAARALVIRQLLLEQAAEMKLSPESQPVAAGKFETDDESLIRQVLETLIKPAAVTEDAIRQTYKADTARFVAPDLYEAAHILFAADPADKVSREKARLRGVACLKTLEGHAEKFSALAQASSDCSSRNDGGVLGQLSTGDTVPEFDAALTEMTPGEISQTLVESRYGFHIIRLDAKAIGAQLPLESVRSLIGEALEKAAWHEAAKKFTGGLLADADISGL